MHFLSRSLTAIEGHFANSVLLRAVRLHFSLGYDDIEETAGFFAMLARPDERYLSKCMRTGEVIAKKTGKPTV